MTLLGPELHVGDPAPEFSLTASDLRRLISTFCSTRGNARRCSSSCRRSTRASARSNRKSLTRGLGELPAGVRAAVVSMDLPFAQARWCGAQGDVKLEMLSDYRDHSFGLNYGLLIEELGLLARAIVVIGKDRTVAYVQIVPEVADEPDYDAALKAAAAAA